MKNEIPKAITLSQKMIYPATTYRGCVSTVAMAPVNFEKAYLALVNF